MGGKVNSIGSFFCSSYSRITLVCNGQETSRLLLEDMDRATEGGHGQKRELNFVVASIFITNSWSNYIFCMATTRRDAMVVDGEELMRQQCSASVTASRNLSSAPAKIKTHHVRRRRRRRQIKKSLIIMIRPSQSVGRGDMVPLFVDGWMPHDLQNNVITHNFTFYFVWCAIDAIPYTIHNFFFIFFLRSEQVAQPRRR